VESSKVELKTNGLESRCLTIDAPTGVSHDNVGGAVGISDIDGGDKSCRVRSFSLVLNLVLKSDSEDGITSTSIKLDAVTLAYLPVKTLTVGLTVNIKSVLVVTCDNDVGRNGYLSKWSGEVKCSNMVNAEGKQRT
jgi:hypothetical protein